MTTAGRVRRQTFLDADARSAVLALATAAGDADGAYPLSEHVVLHLRQGGEAPAVHLLAHADRQRDDPDRTPRGRLIGYAHVDVTDPVAGASAEAVVHPAHRRAGLGRALIHAALDVASEGRAPAGRLRLWAHGGHPSASALALAMGFTRQRTLLQLRRSLYAPVPEPRFPSGVRLRPFRAGTDDDAWLALNAEAFADLPDQGRLVRADLHARLAEPWFDPAGFLLAERVADGALLGFHWTKVHGTARDQTPPDHTPPHPHDPIGEVYVLGVAPAAASTGLGTALTLAGLRYLRGRGLDQAMLYVDEANPRAMALYTKLGFARWSTDICFTRAV
ncbi:MAG: mycothiol synthase [Dactylosporangium sp.]|nr:mycothiol synthase [Dactylosporangium sp.]NNJ63164.1 mycothiol synthase [Dactylosporangium sp.]